MEYEINDLHYKTDEATILIIKELQDSIECDSLKTALEKFPIGSIYSYSCKIKCSKGEFQIYFKYSLHFKLQNICVYDLAQNMIVYSERIDL